MIFHGVKMKILKLITLFFPVICSAEEIQFSLPTLDKKAVINGQVDLPVGYGSKDRNIPTVLMVGGTGLFDRDYNYGASKSHRDLLFKELSKALNRVGVATARYDYRGVSCNERTVKPCRDCKEKSSQNRHYVSSCINNAIRATVTAANPSEDAATVYNYLLKQGITEENAIVILSHSEGTIHTSQLISQQAFNPKGLLMLGFVAESAKNIFQWQFTSRMRSAYWELDFDHNQKIDNTEIEKFCTDNSLPSVQCSPLKSPDGFWTHSTLRDKILKAYEDSRRDAFSHPKTEEFKYIYSEFGAVFASYDWWQLFFSETINNVERLFKFQGKISFNNGEIDGATPAHREFALVNLYKDFFAADIRINSYPRLGHSLGQNQMTGPMDYKAMEKIISEIRWLLE